jgi:glutaconyl-CoA/methylmalonyl-CoA decarboxylase subunit gamma
LEPAVAKHLRITVEGKAYDVLVEDVGEVDTASAPATALPAVPASAAPSSPPPAALPVAAGGSSAGDKRAPLGGMILELPVQVGDRVKAGDRVAVIEAMKMKTVITAHKDGQISNVAVRVGDVVDAGQVLVTIG